MIEVHKIVNVLVGVDNRKLFTLDNSLIHNSWGHPKKLKMNYFFTNHVIREWNSLETKKS